MARQVRECLPDPTWKHAELIDKVSVAFAEAINRVSCRPYPLYLPRSLSGDPFELWSITCSRRVAWDTWEWVPPRDSPVTLEGGLRLF